MVMSSDLVWPIVISRDCGYYYHVTKSLNWVKLVYTHKIPNILVLKNKYSRH